MLLIVIVIGLLSRRYAAHLPALLHKNAGDILWDTATYLLIAIAWPRLPSARVLAAAIAAGIAVELFKLYNPPWLDLFRLTTAGGLLLGHVFSWSNLVCYVFGGAIGFMVDRMLLGKFR